VQHHRRLSLGVAADLEIEAIAVADLEQAHLERLHLGIEPAVPPNPA
jgi:hypothetical protein